MNSVGCVGATLSPGLVCRKSPKTAAFCQTPSFSWPSITGGASSLGMRTGASFLTYLGLVGTYVFTSDPGGVTVSDEGFFASSGVDGATGCARMKDTKENMIRIDRKSV